MVNAEDIPAAELEKEADKARARGKEEGKSGAVIDKIVEGYLEKYKENVAAIGENLVVRRFQRWELGESTGEA